MVGRKGRNVFWWRPLLDELPQQHSKLWAEVLEVGKRRRITDFTVAATKVSGRVQDDSGRMFRVEFQSPALTDSQWSTILLELSEQSLALASFLAGVLPVEVRDVFLSHGVSLVPSPEDIRHRCECPDGAAWCSHQLSLWDRLRERIDEDPFTLFFLLGKTRDELVGSLRQQRVVRQKAQARPDLSLALLNELQLSGDEYWKLDPRLAQVAYNIRADELPAALLKRLEPLPIEDLETDADRAMEESYEQVARRAQAFGLGMIRSR